MSTWEEQHDECEEIRLTFSFGFGLVNSPPLYILWTISHRFHYSCLSLLLEPNQTSEPNLKLFFSSISCPWIFLVCSERGYPKWIVLTCIIIITLCTTSERSSNTLAEFKSFVMNNKAFGNLFCNSQKSFHTSPGSSDSNKKRLSIIFQTQQWHLHLQKILDVFFL